MADAPATAEDAAHRVTGVGEGDVPLGFESQEGAGKTFVDVSQSREDSAELVVPLFQHGPHWAALTGKQLQE